MRGWIEADQARIALASMLLLLLAACNLPGRTETPAPQDMTATPTPAPTITPTWEVPEDALLAPDGSRYAVVRGGGLLYAGSPDGSVFEVASAEEIGDLGWFPDSRHLIYVDRVPSDSPLATLRDRLWIADLEQQETHAVGPGFAPLLSPDGRYLAFMHGERAGDACIVAYGLGIVELNEQFVPTALVRQRQIAGFPLSEEAHSFLPDVGPERAFPGQWQGADTLEVRMRWACRDDFGDDGLYEVQVESLQAEKTGELPTPEADSSEGGGDGSD